MNKHVHYDYIVAWAAGHSIEYYSQTTKSWYLCTAEPNWTPQRQYRIATPPKKKVKMWKALVETYDGFLTDSLRYYKSIEDASSACGKNRVQHLLPYTEIEVDE